jgi:hypothetical protein
MVILPLQAVLQRQRGSSRQVASQPRAWAGTGTRQRGGRRQPGGARGVRLTGAASRGVAMEGPAMKSILLYFLGVPVFVIILLNIFGVL